MTVRWSGVARGIASAKRVRAPTGDLEVERRWVFPRRSAAVSKGGVSTWVLVARNVGCRDGFEASWRCVRGLAVRPNEAQSRAVEKASRPERGRWSLSSAEGCSGRAKAARPA
jgi:hypothetical protein